MSKALSVDLRTRVLAAVSAGALHREAAERFGVGVASVGRWRNLQLEKGNGRPGPLGGDRSSHKTEAHADLIMAWLGEHRDGTLFELRDALSAQGVVISKSALHRFLVRHNQTRKKTGHAVEQSRPDLLEMRQSWFDKQLDLDSILHGWSLSTGHGLQPICHVRTDAASRASGCEWASHMVIARQRHLLQDCETQEWSHPLSLTDRSMGNGLRLMSVRFSFRR